MLEAQRILVEAGLLPKEMPNSVTFNKVRQILSEIEGGAPSEIKEAARLASNLQIRGPLAVVIFIKHHLQGEHGVEIDRITKAEEGEPRYGVLIYPEGELPVNIKHLPSGITEGSRIRYEASKGEYTRD